MGWDVWKKDIKVESGGKKSYPYLFTDKYSINK